MRLTMSRRVQKVQYKKDLGHGYAYGYGHGGGSSTPEELIESSELLTRRVCVYIVRAGMASAAENSCT